MEGSLDICRLRTALEGHADTADAAAMAAYLRHRYAFLGVRAGPAKQASATFVAAGQLADASELIRAADTCWAQPEREFQLVGVKLLRRWPKNLRANNIDDLERYLTTKSWWDTVDELAARVVGPLVKESPELVATMDRWSVHPNIWLARAAILHQLGYRDATDPDRLFRYAIAQAHSDEFFIRKAIGWSLRQYARIDPGLVAAFVANNESRLSSLSRREALKHTSS